MSKRLQYKDATIEAFGDEFLVVCPRCAQRAVVRDRGPDAQPHVALTCESCGYSQLWESTTSGILVASNRQHYKPGQISIGDAVDWYFHLPFHYRTENMC